jgi:hypothetical protein
MSKFLDPTERLQLHLEYSQKRDGWADRGLDLSEAGKRDEAIEALDEARFWDLKARSLEPDP